MNPKKIAAVISVTTSVITGSTVGLLYANEEDSLEILERAETIYGDFERTSVDTIISESVKDGQSEGGDDGGTTPEPPLPGVTPPDPAPNPGTYTPNGEWYDYTTGKSLKYSTTPYKTINIGTGNGTEEIGLYSGLPWDPSGVSYIYNNRQAAEDVISYIETVSGLDSGLSVKSAFVYEFAFKASKSNIKEVDGIPTIGVALPPSVFYDAYCNNFTQEMWKSVSCPDASYYERKACVILQDTSGNVFYMPTHKGDAKAHTFPGGAIQTHLKVKGHDSATNTYTIDIGDKGERSKPMTITDVVNYLDTVVAPGSSNENSPLRAYWKVNVEVKRIKSEALKELNTYKVMGVVVW